MWQTIKLFVSSPGVSVGNIKKKIRNPTARYKQSTNRIGNKKKANYRFSRISSLVVFMKENYIISFAAIIQAY